VNQAIPLNGALALDFDPAYAAILGCENLFPTYSSDAEYSTVCNITGS